MNSSARTQQMFQLPDGRVLGYADYGALGGKPLFYFHGWPSLRIEFAGLAGDEIAAQLNVRVIAVDRPGIGLSGYQPRHRFTDWPHDVFFVCVFSLAGLPLFLALRGDRGRRFTAWLCLGWPGRGLVFAGCAARAVRGARYRRRDERRALLVWHEELA
jgi:pimeloyl-ACP methyl ester carboxylesterase